ncbi:C40 family peptidase [Nocardiopsis sp. MG754419]|uniref:C40 family peptidase n=1 Tax=Nocardiopsis sp. MG754419 TaxID=2259865 RepID=UPI001BAE3D5C|nr:C40 family peptidase [Nocardiopsis sp. MG754419]MBR8744303.1 peptidoglycan endopeptidase [Nocardiopsis sp. MG754419]
MRNRLRTCAGTTAAFAVAFTAFGATPAMAEPVVEERPSLSDQVSPDTASPSGARPGDAPSPDEQDVTTAQASPDVADVDELRRDTHVAPFREARSVEYFAVAPDTLPREVVNEIRRIEGVEHVLTVDAARVQVDGEPTSVLGVHPSTFRNHAPEPSAESDEIWQGVAEGHIALSKDVGTERELELGGDVTVAGGHGEIPMEVWTHATSGIAGIDALVSRERARELGMPEGNALVISAPDADLRELHETLEEAFGEDAQLQLIADAPEAEDDGDTVPTSVIEEVIAHTETQLGVPYVWGGTTPNVGFDCSGLLQWAFREAGVSIPRVTHDQWNAGSRVEWDDLERGDLLFWRSDPTAPDYISHVAIYLGDGEMLEAPRTGLDVRVTPVRTDNYAGAVRVHT